MADVVTPLSFPAAADMPPLLPADWTMQVAVTTTYRTEVSKSATTLTEERRALTLRPYRDLAVRLGGMTAEQSHKLFCHMLRRVRGRIPVPLYCDQAETTATSSATTINCPTADRRFYAGGRAVIFKPKGSDVDWDAANDIEYAEYARVDSLTATALTLKVADSLTLSYPAGCIVMPCIDAEVTLGSEQGGGTMFLLTDRISYADVAASEVLGPSALPAEATGNPAGFSTYNSKPILDMDPEWGQMQEILLSHDGTVEEAGRTNHVWLQGATHRVGFRLYWASEVRAEVAKIRRFFDSRVGMLKDFYLVSPQDLFMPTARGVNYIDVAAQGFVDADAFPLVGVVLNDGTVYIYPVSSVAAIGGGPGVTTGWRITFTVNTDVFAVADVARVSSAHFVRFNSDSLSETWDTDGVCALSIDAVELVQEGAVVVTDA